MKCEAMQELFSPYLDKMTSSKENQSLEAHLEICPECRGKLEELRAVCALLKGLPHPIVPLNFDDDLQKRLSQDNIKIFAPREIKMPSKPSWLVTGVASVALGVGVFLSSYLPWGTMVASVQDWFDRDKGKPPAVAVDTILNKVNIGDNIQSEQNPQIAQNNAGSNSSGSITQLPDGKVMVTPPAATVNPTVASVQESAQPKVVDSYLTKIMVPDIGSSVQKVIQIAGMNGGEYALLPSDRNLASATAAAHSVKVISLQVPKDKADLVISQLRDLGATNPVQYSTNYTQQYADTVSQLNSVAGQIASLQASSDLTMEQQGILSDLKQKQEQLLKDKADLENRLDMVNIEVRLVENA
jgi:hypothetical protein